MKRDAFMLEFDGTTTTRKVTVKAGGFERYPFQLEDLESLDHTDNKYLICKVFFEQYFCCLLEIWLCNHAYM